MGKTRRHGGDAVEEVCLRSPIGFLRISGDKQGVSRIEFIEPRSKLSAFYKISLKSRSQNPHLLAAKKEIQEYFLGKRQQFQFALHLQGTPFQQAVWQELLKIPFGTTFSYGEIAERVGRPKAVRAVGMANHLNPLGIVVPCHRVVGKDKKLVGYAGGLWRKTWLLKHEGAMLV